MEHTTTHSGTKGGQAILILLALFAIILILAKVFKWGSSSFHYPKGKCLLPNAKYGCKREYSDGSYDCVSCETMRRREWGESNYRTGYYCCGGSDCMVVGSHCKCWNDYGYTWTPADICSGLKSSNFTFQKIEMKN